MLYERLGSSGLSISKLSLGTWVTFGYQLDVEAAYPIFKRAYELGINFFDCAETYAQGKAEQLLGQVFRKGEAEGVWSREDLILSTKIFFGSTAKPSRTAQGLSRKHIVEGTRASLRRLGLEHVDLLYAHRPDPATPIEETVRAFGHCVEQGMAHYWGTSEWEAAQIAEACRIADRLGLPRPTMEQPQYNMFHRKPVEQEYAPFFTGADGWRLGLTTWSPLYSGVLSGKYSGGRVPEDSRLAMERYSFLKERAFADSGRVLDAVDRLTPIAEQLGCSLSQLAIAWCAANPNVSSVILGASKMKQLEENVHALEVVPKLSAEVRRRIDQVITPELQQ